MDIISWKTKKLRLITSILIISLTIFIFIFNIIILGEISNVMIVASLILIIKIIDFFYLIFQKLGRNNIFNFLINLYNYIIINKRKQE